MPQPCKSVTFVLDGSDNSYNYAPGHTIIVPLIVQSKILIRNKIFKTCKNFETLYNRMIFKYPS